LDKGKHGLHKALLKHLAEGAHGLHKMLSKQLDGGSHGLNKMLSKHVDGSGYGLNNRKQEFGWTVQRTTKSCTKIQTKHLPNSNLQHYSYAMTNQNIRNLDSD